MDESVTSLGRLADPATRRLWLLTEALRCVPLIKAVKLAREAEGFITAAPTIETSEVSGDPAEATNCAVTTRTAYDRGGNISSMKKPIGLALSSDRREQLLDRLAQGASNAEVAQVFSLSTRQVQGMRMGAARDITNRRQRIRSSRDDAGIACSPEEVIRYLRQQDDVVVRQDDGPFLVNGRFRLGLADLVSRANRMRARQGKREFHLANVDGPRGI